MIYDSIMNGLTKDEREGLETILEQNSVVNKIMKGGKMENIRQNVDIILECRRKINRGAYNVASLAILNKIVSKEDELDAIKERGIAKYNVKNVKQNEEEKNKRENKKLLNVNIFDDQEKYIGQTNATERKNASSATSEIELIIQNNRNKNNKVLRNSGDKNVNGSNTDFSNSKTRRAVRDIPRVNANDSSNENDIENRKKSIYSFSLNKEDNDDRDEKIKNGERTRKSDQAKDTFEFDDETRRKIDDAINEEGRPYYRSVEIERRMQDIARFNNNSIALKNLNRLKANINIINNRSTGKYTAEELLQSIHEIRNILPNDVTNTYEKEEIERILSTLNCNLDYAEGYIRADILNNPKIVGDNSKIVEESREYMVQYEDELPEIIKNGLGFKMEELKSNRDLEYMRRPKPKPSYVQEEYKNRMKDVRKTEGEITKLDKNKITNKDIAKEVYGVAKELGRTAVGIVGTTVDASVGIITSGAATDGKEDIAIQAASNFFAGKGISETVGKRIVGFAVSTGHTGEKFVKEGVKFTSSEIKHAIGKRKKK